MWLSAAAAFTLERLSGRASGVTDDEIKQSFVYWTLSDDVAKFVLNDCRNRRYSVFNENSQAIVAHRRLLANYIEAEEFSVVINMVSSKIVLYA